MCGACALGHWTRLFLRVTGVAALVPGGAHTREISVNAQSAACRVRAVTAAQNSGPHRQSATPSMWIGIPPIRQLAADGGHGRPPVLGLFWVRGRHEGRQECSASEPACLDGNLEAQRGTRPEVGDVANGHAEGVLLDPVPRCRGALCEIARTRAEERLNGKGLRRLCNKHGPGQRRALAPRYGWILPHSWDLALVLAPWCT
jgi:hypothetical protein